ncbi:MAG: single-stranded DNA-binding protein [Acidobacteriaceae bacterium]|nr:single-stranded DNA-binding protein [Acidobacteriaceae bacterium]
MEDLALAAEKIASLMRTLTGPEGFRLKYRITAGAGAKDPDGFERRDIYVECKGPDAELLLERDGELLRSLEHVAAKVLRLEPEEHDRVSFDANGFKAERASSLRELADEAMDTVGESKRPYNFPPMNSRERRMLHMFLKDSGMQTASSGEGARRFVVLYPEGYRVPREDDRRGGSGRDRRGGGRGDRGGSRRGGGRGRY